MTSDELREVLGRVAVGELQADEAVRLLDADAASADQHQVDGPRADLDIPNEPAGATAPQWAPLWLGRL